MPFKDAEKEREYRKLQARRRRAEAKARQLGANTPNASDSKEPPLQPHLTPDDWKAEKLAAGWDWWERHKALLSSQPIAAARLAFHAIALIEANLEEPPPSPDSLPPGLETKAHFLTDPEYRRLLQQLAVREGQLRDQEG